MIIRDLRAMTKMTQQQFADYFEIPSYRTIQNWEGGQRKCPPHLEKLIQYKLIKEGFTMKLIEKNEGESKLLVEGCLENIVTWLKNNKDEYEWIRDNEKGEIPEENYTEMPDFSNVETLQELEYELDKINLSWWALRLEL